MGNQLSSIAPSQILSVDHYLTDLYDYEYDSRYGLTFRGDVFPLFTTFPTTLHTQHVSFP